MGFLFWATASKTAAYILTFIILFAVILDPPKTIQAALLVIVSEYYQGVALPAIGAVGKRAEEAAKIEGDQTRKLLQETHDAVLDEFNDIREMVGEVHEMHRETHEKMDRILALMEGGKNDPDSR